MFKRVRGGVRRKSKNRQVPWESTSIEGDFYFVPPKSEPKQVAKATPGPQSGTKQSSIPAASAETVFWQSIGKSTNAADYRAYLNRFPKGTYSELAKIRLREIETTQTASLPQTTRARTDVVEMEKTFVALSRSNLRKAATTTSPVVGRLDPGTTVIVTGKLKSRNWYRVASRDGGSAFVFGELLAPIDPAQLGDWQRISNSKKAEDYREFLKRYPRSPLAATARSRAARAEQASRPPVVAQASPSPSPAPSVDPGRKTQQALGIFPTPAAPGRTFRDCPGCPEMVTILAGRFRMGAPPSEQGRSRHEGPQRVVTGP